MARVLVVDDAAFMRKMVSDALTKGGHEVVGEAGNGTEAIARFQELKPEVMTLDITMPEKDGLAALKDIMELEPSARVIMCSALGQESKVLESIKLGATGFVVKPFLADRVLEAIAPRVGPPRGPDVVNPRPRAPRAGRAAPRARRRTAPPCRRRPSGARPGSGSGRRVTRPAC